MTDEPDAAPTFPNPSLPRGWRGGTLEGVLPPLHDDWYLEGYTEPARVAEMTTWAPLEELEAGDPPGQTGFDLGSVGAGGGGPRPPERLSGAVLRVSSTLSGLIVDALPETWLNLSRYGPAIDLQGVRVGDVLEVEVERGRDGRCYLVAIKRVDDGRGRA